MKKINSSILAASVFFISLATNNVIASSLCTNENYVVGYFNSEWTTEAHSVLETAVLSKQFPSENFANIAYESYYGNSTWQDVLIDSDQTSLSLFIERAESIEPGLGENIELLWSMYAGNADQTFEKIIGVLQSQETVDNSLLVEKLKELYQQANIDASEYLENFNVSEKPLSTNQKSRIETLALEGNGLFLVAHRQGNYFANKAYEVAKNIDGFEGQNINILHLSPFTDNLNGNYLLAQQDLVLAHYSQGESSNMPFVNAGEQYVTDESGFLSTMVSTYTSDVYMQVSTLLRESLVNDLQQIELPITVASKGAFSVTFSWESIGDADLWIQEPNGTIVFFGHLQGEIGYLDVDNREGYGPEHYYASCDADVLQTGQYIIKGLDYSETIGQMATIQVSTPFKADLITKSFEIMNTSQGAEDALSAFNQEKVSVVVNVTQGDAGDFDISIQ